MLVILDSNILLSALISSKGAPFQIYESWHESRFHLVTSTEQLDELRRASRYPKFRHTLQPHLVGLMLNRMRRATVYRDVPRRNTASDPADAFLLDLAEISAAHYLVTGDKRAGLLSRKRISTTSIVTASAFCKEVMKP